MEGGNVELIDSESGERIDLALGEAERERYRLEFGRYIESWRSRCLRSGVRFVWLCSDEPYEEVFFRTMTRAGLLG